VLLNENFIFSRPLTVTGAYRFPTGEVVFHQMTLDRIDNGEYVLQNSEISVDDSGMFLIFVNMIIFFSKI